MAEKKQLSAEEIYKKNQKKAKALKILAPICFWGMLALSLVCLIFAVKNSFGNIAEITSLLDNDNFTGEQLKQNYEFLTEKYGTWVIGSGGSGFTLTFVNIGKAVFSGVMIANVVMFFVFLVGAFVIGKWLLPKLAEQTLTANQDMVNLTILKQKDKE